MTRSGRRHRDKSTDPKDLSDPGDYHGTAARTRPFSFEDILFRRKTKLVKSHTKIANFSRNHNFADRPQHENKVTEDAPKRSSRKEEIISSKEQSLIKAGDRAKERKIEKESHHRSRTVEHSRDDKGKEHKSEKKSPHTSRNEQHTRDDKETIRSKEHKDELGTEAGRVNERKNEKESHHRSRKEEHSRGDKEIGRAKEHRRENKSPHTSRKEERTRDDKEAFRSIEHENEKQHHHRSRNEKRLRDDVENIKEHSEKLVGKDKFVENELVKSEREGKREHRSREEGRDGPELDADSVKKHSSGKYNLESTEKKDRNKYMSESFDEGSERKKRRSRSPESRARDRSISLSPRGHKRTYVGREHGESSLHSPKDRKPHSDLDRNRVTSNGGHTSNHSWRHGGRGSGIGGYSPRKRRSEAAIRTPSPTARSPEKKSVVWDHTLKGTAARPDAVQSSHHSVTVEHNLSSSATVRLSDLESPYGALLSSKAKDATVEPAQLPQATQALRRLYVENLPASASDKSVMECFNNFLMYVGANHIQKNQPCISCTINKEKDQAVVEFLTAEDAGKALSFDGRSFSNSILKISRPKDLFEAANGVAEKSAPTVDAISETVKDSPHKIFIGGVSTTLSSDMLMEIVSAFGCLKAFHYVDKNDPEEACAFLEYNDESIALKACAGLNGMKLGGKVLTVGLAVPDASVEENTGKSPFYEIPEHTKPLLLEPTKVLRLKNVFKTEHLSSLSEAEVEEILEDIRLECARFGSVKSINVVRCESNSGIAKQTDESILIPHPEDESFTKGDVETREQDGLHESGEKSIPEAAINDKERLEDAGSSKNDTLGDDKPNGDYQIDNGITTYSNANSQEVPPQLVSNATECVQGEDASKNDKITHDNESVEDEDTSKNVDMVGGVNEEANHELQEAPLQLNNNSVGGSEGSDKYGSKQGEDVFEQGSVFVEYVRSEASCIAAHSLHERLYGEQSVLVDYIPHDVYMSRFRK